MLKARHSAQAARGGCRSVVSSATGAVRFIAESGEWKHDKLPSRIKVRRQQPGQKGKPEPPQHGQAGSSSDPPQDWEGDRRAAG
ncbi:hypothetical protein GCM10010909_16050 [Acidocella aquatica]|uniref:Uncharacterized protein n=1 Tax=Acidocella aquatica TaxID=1922313 RepID=A0ABQ6A354_9PROT|nr:hypothetical protein GCM10010909_16050 [Acidocella aquatica]